MPFEPGRQTSVAPIDEVAGRPALLVLRPLLLRLMTRGCDVPRLLDACGVPPGRVNDPQARIDQDQLVAVWRGAEEITGDPLIGVHALEVVDFRIIDVSQVSDYPALQLLSASRTLGEGLARYARYHEALNAPCRIRWCQGPSEGVATYETPPAPESPRALVEYNLGVLVCAARAFAMTAPGHMRVRFAHAARGPAAEYERIFGVPVEFGHDEDCLVVGAPDLALPLRTARSAGVIRAFERRGDELLARQAEGDLPGQVRAVIERGLEQGLSAIGGVAEQLRTSPRTLARRLRDAGTSYQTLLHEVRAERARHYLLHTDLPLSDIAALLAFTDASTFNRAFRQWFAEAPAAFRQRRPERPGD